MATRTFATINIGCAGWSLPSKTADSFPAGGSHLERYSAVFSAVEINSSFYRPHLPKTYARWRDSVPDDFSFAVKMPRAVSHERRLQNTDALLDRFLSEAGELGSKLGCLLLQLPPSLAFDACDADAFFELLRRKTKTAVACEPRHRTWFSDAAADAMRRHAITCVDANPRPVPDVQPAVFDQTVYLRLHGSPIIYRSAYDERFLDAVAQRIEKCALHVDTIWCIFDNTAEGAAIPNALSLKQWLL